MFSEWIEIRVMPDPSRFKLVTRVGKHTFQHIESPLYITQVRINAGRIVLSPNIVRVDRQRSG